MLPHFPTIAPLAIEADIQADLLRCAIHAFDRFDATGQWPAALQTLDRFTARPLSLKEKEGMLILYSAGRDGVDDGGDPAADLVLTLGR